MQIFKKGDRVRIKATNEFPGLVGTAATVMYDTDDVDHDERFIVFIVPDNTADVRKWYAPGRDWVTEWSYNLEPIHPAHIERRNGRRILVIND